MFSTPKRPGPARRLRRPAARSVWTQADPDVLAHDQFGLSANHPHLDGEHVGCGHRHAHAFVIDDLHQRWPTIA